MTEHSLNPNDQDAISAAKRALAQRLREIAAALHDLKNVQYSDGLAWRDDPLAFAKAANRYTLLITQIYHIKDLAKKAERPGSPSEDNVDRLVAGSEAIRRCGEVANTYKHGTGGRKKRDAVLDYCVPVFKQSGEKPSLSDKLVGYDFLICDHRGDLHSANATIEGALEEWLIFLERVFSVRIEASLWPVKGNYLYRAEIPKGLEALAKSKAKGTKRS